MISKKKLYLVIFFFLAASCSLPKDTDEKFEPSLKKRTEDAAKRDGGIILFGGDKKSVGVTDFSSTNVMWRATLKTLNFMPLVTADYSAGLIVTDWYSDQKKSNEQIKIQISFTSNEVRSDSVIVNTFKKICEIDGKCTNVTVSNNFNNEIKNLIIDNARLLKVEEVKNKKP